MSTVFPHLPQGSPKPEAASQVSGTSNEKVPARLCYVDDSRTSAYVVKRMLRPYGYAVDHFESAEPALVALVQASYDLLLTDLKVSPKGMDGDDLVRALRNSGHEKISDMPVIVITGATDSDILTQVYEAGANHILTKPVNGDELDAEIRKLVFARKHEQEDATQQNPTESPSIGATVVSFGAELKKHATTADHIPVLKPESLDLSDLSTASTTASTVETNQAPKKTKSESRRYLGIQPSGANQDEGQLQIHNPLPITSHKPAARVKPTIKTKTKPVATNSDEASIALGQTSHLDVELETNEISLLPDTGVAGSHSAVESKKSIGSSQKIALSKKPSKHTNLSAGTTLASDILRKKQKEIVRSQNKLRETSERLLKDSTTTQRSLDKAAALRKVKAAVAAKKAKLAEQRKLQEQQSKPDISSSNRIKSSNKANEILSKLNSSELSIEPDYKDTSNTFQQPAANVHSLHGNVADNHEVPTLDAVAQPQQLPFKEKPGVNTAVISDSANSSKQGKVDEVLEAFQQTGSNRSDILKSMDQFPLVESDFGQNYSPARVLRMANSILELYGPKRILTGIALLGILFIGYGYWTSVIDDGVPVSVTTVEQGEIFQSITVPGHVVSKLKVNMTPSIAGRVTKIFVNEGDHVKKGDLLASLDDREAKSNLTRTMANLDSTKEDVVLAERSLKRLKQAYSKGAVARQMVDQARAELRSAQARQSIAEEGVRTAKLGLENPRIVAPFSGTVTSRHLEVGQWVVPSQTLLTLVDESQREIEVKVDAADSGGIAVGQTVSLSSDAFPGRKWTEAVTRLAAATNSVGNANTVNVYISLSKKAPSLRFGQQVDADIRTAWNPNALKVPYGAIINKGGKSFVMVSDKGHAHFVQVETGIEDLNHVEILQGVKIGQSVILANGKHIKDGQKVYLAANSKR